METTTKFDIGNFVHRKFEQPLKDEDGEIKERVSFLEIMAIHIDICYAGVQVFYLCRHIFFKKQYNTSDFEVHHSINTNNDGKLGWHKYSETELVEVDDKVLNIINKKLK